MNKTAIEPRLRDLNLLAINRVFSHRTAPQNELEADWRKHMDIAQSPAEQTWATRRSAYEARVLYNEHFALLLYAPIAEERAEIKRSKHRFNIFLKKLENRVHAVDQQSLASNVVQVVEPRIGLNEDFIASESLIHIWQNGVMSAFLESGLDEAEFEKLANKANKDFFLQKEFKAKLTDCVINFGLSKYRNSPMHLCFDWKFMLSFQNSIMARFFIRPDEASEFFSLLAKELNQWLHAGNIMDGDWGSLTSDGQGSITLNFSPIRAFKTRGFEPSDE